MDQVNHEAGMQALRKVQGESPIATTQIKTIHDSPPPTPKIRPSDEERDRWATEEAEASATKEMRRRADQVAELSHTLGKRYSPDRVQIEGFEVYDAKQTPIIAAVKKIASELPTLVANGESLIWYGPVGTGKDHMMAYLLYVAAGHGIDCKWVNGVQVYSTIRDRIDSGRLESELLNELARPTVLAISDPIPPARKPSDFNVEQLYILMDRRSRDAKSTWVNFNAASENDAYEKLSAPVFDRLRDGARIFPCFWPSYRERRKP